MGDSFCSLFELNHHEACMFVPVSQRHSADPRPEVIENHIHYVRIGVMNLATLLMRSPLIAGGPAASYVT